MSRATNHAVRSMLEVVVTHNLSKQRRVFLPAGVCMDCIPSAQLPDAWVHAAAVGRWARIWTAVLH
jgi:hypothetical protein